jgi:predicted RNase H-like nuclease (RuvC/YqgF family)
MKDLSDIVCEVTGPMTMRSIENHRRLMEDLYVKSTAQGASPEEQAAFTPELIANAFYAAMLDNAKTTVAWARAIYNELYAEDPLDDLKSRLSHLQDKVRFFNRELAVIDEGRAFATLPAEERERQAEATERALREAQKEVLSLEKDLRDLQQPQTPVLGRAPQAGPTWSQPSGHDDLDGHLPPVP